MNTNPIAYHGKINVKLSTLEKLIELINEGDTLYAIGILRSLLDEEFRTEVRKTKELLFFQMKYANTVDERERYRKAYEEYMANSLL